MSIVPQIPPVEVYRGDDVTFPTLRFKQGGEPVDLTGVVFAAQWRETPESAEAVDFTVAVADPNSGEVVLSLTSEQTATMGPLFQSSQVYRAGRWDLQGTKDGQTRTWARGTTKMIAEVTR